jgi:hypothetical protein
VTDLTQLVVAAEEVALGVMVGEDIEGFRHSWVSKQGMASAVEMEVAARS